MEGVEIWDESGRFWRALAAGDEVVGENSHAAHRKEEGTAKERKGRHMNVKISRLCGFVSILFQKQQAVFARIWGDG